MSEKLCWNCANAKRSNGLMYSPCDLYLYDLPCKYKPLDEISCHNCKNAGLYDDCLLGISFGDSRCEFKPRSLKVNPQIKLMTRKDKKPEIEYLHKRIICPMVRYNNSECSGGFQTYGFFNPCTDCPIDWSKLRV